MHTKPRIALLLTVSLATGHVVASDDPLAARKVAWQQGLGDEFYFDEREADVPHALAEFQGDCQIAMVYDPKKSDERQFEIRNAGKVVATLTGSTASVFVGSKGRFYFADFDRASCGCTVVAIDTTTGKQLWKTELRAIGPQSHLFYSNQILLEARGALPSDWPLDCKTIFVHGRESFGCYKEVIDAATGERLAHKTYDHVTTQS